MRETAEVVNVAARALADIILGMLAVTENGQASILRELKNECEPRFYSKFRHCARARRIFLVACKPLSKHAKPGT